MVDPDYGAVCTIDLTADQSEMTTHRLSYSEWESALGQFVTNQASITDAIVATSGDLSTITVGTNDALDYMDALHCEKDSELYATAEGSKHRWVCTGWQVDWRSSALSDGYPRFGTTDAIITTFIDAVATTTISEKWMILEEAIALAAGATFIFIITV